MQSYNFVKIFLKNEAVLVFKSKENVDFSKYEVCTIELFGIEHRDVLIDKEEFYDSNEETIELFVDERIDEYARWN